MAFMFSTKARTLAQLLGVLQSAKIVPLIYFTVAQWRESSENCIKSIIQQLAGDAWIVRSSCKQEDCFNQSSAGVFLSLQNVNISGLDSAITQVLSSYLETVDLDEVLVQPMLQHVIRSGVAFSHDPSTGEPYRMINWSEGEDTAVITGGGDGCIWRQAACYCSDDIPKEILSVIALLDELLDHFGEVPIDFEFAITLENDEEILWLLQVRPLLIVGDIGGGEEQMERLQRIHNKVEMGMLPHPFLIGKRTVYGVMPDWNPAEIIGIRPKPLALSLYRDLITDSIWAYQRHNYGYRNLRSFPLMQHFYGLPYIDLRLSFNSFIPADLPEGLAGRLVDYYIDSLLEKPQLHDKVEFEIVYSCYTLDLPQRMTRLREVGFSQEECDSIAESLRRLTNRVIHPEKGLWRSDAAKLDILSQRREELSVSSNSRLEKIYWLLEDAKRYGSLPFAGLARAGFIAVQMLRSLVEVRALSQRDYDAFVSSVSTVSTQLVRDRSNLSQVAFLSRYGHLRPGTYDILSQRYDEAPELYFDWTQRPLQPDPVAPFSLTLEQMRQIAILLEEHDLHADPVGLFDFLQAGIEMREFAKFQFTKNLSDAMVLIADVGQECGISREDLAYCDISVFQELYMSAGSPREMLLRSIQQGKARYADALKISLPPVIAAPKDVFGFKIPESTPNYITQKNVMGNVVDNTERQRLPGSIVCIPNADPGYDWLFSYPIVGLVTAWGGANSHMAIRAGEMGLPAVIGAGEVLYQKWSQARRIHLDCAAQRVMVLQ
ncbi:MAG: phosphoenolpyruvate synthase [Candidatus Marinimicrobia bacterium]|jgi:glutamine kinase|nr:phosphoenolpyruvate synthase [Gammaproteobacteria bacterium]MBT4605559.1 phosphoenolpyruvate synthase [Thiotrichales bacterium]MBT4948041.1 phosphoenolpyruvate synthase [Candidatus Neomarinimicrobiota bacterium]MBT5371320.1 phosphoenolpyruvate synthase [Gammaproteobacteria bacterium]MBT6217729.1 phosphoenolpyruvate synthase [Candidatus Neomarinimicrobiota bacterium]